MKKRIITGVVAFALFLPFLIFSHTFMFTACFMLLGGIATFEMLGCVGLRKNVPAVIISFLYTESSIVLSRVFNSSQSYLEYMLFASLTVMILFATIALFSKGKVPIDRVTELFTMMFYIAVAFSCILLVRDSVGGQFLFFLIFIGAWGTDIFAYFTGVKLGKHKLIPDVSPKKTVEGAIGGIVGCTAVMLIYALGILIFTDLSPKFLTFLVCGVLLSVVSMIGDLIMSLLKRRHKIKDFSNIMPGHGGMLDRFDSVMACAPFLMLLITFMHFFK